MARMLCALAVAAGLFGGVGCCSTCGCDSPVRQDELLNQSFDSGLIGERPATPLETDQPSHMKEERIRGGIM